MKIQFNRIITIITLAATTGVLTSCDSLFRDVPSTRFPRSRYGVILSFSTNTRTLGTDV